MKQQSYISLHQAVACRPALRAAVIRSTRPLPALVYGAYPLMLLWLALAHRDQLLRALAVPAAGFLTVTLLRAAINAPRPYEVLDLPPISPKDTRGKSFPSRHAACAAVIAVTAWALLPPLGAALGLIAVLIAVSRVLAGVHFLRDVVCGLLLGGFIGLAGMYLVP